jgi:hypothetical protein
MNLRKRPVLEGTYDVPSREPLPVSAGTLRRGRAVAEALFASDAGAPDQERLVWLEREMASFVGHAGEDARRILGLSLLAVTVLGPIMAGKWGFLGRSLAERQAILARVEHSFLSTALLAVKAVLCILYFEHPAATREIGGPFGCLVEGEGATVKGGQS